LGLLKSGKGLKVEERDFALEELTAANEVFLTSSSLILRPVTKIDGKIIGDGKAGKIARDLSGAYKRFIG
jgi:branched-subunit amino acid aminotransferase/4-amino-4-deoxychorismate lyase